MKQITPLYLLILMFCWLPLTAQSIEINSVGQAYTSVLVAAAVTSTNEKPAKVDGKTSASVLRARRSHAVSKEDETGLAVFFGVIVISVILVLFNPFKDKN